MTLCYPEPIQPRHCFTIPVRKVLVGHSNSSNDWSIVSGEQVIAQNIYPEEWVDFIVLCINSAAEQLKNQYTGLADSEPLRPLGWYPDWYKDQEHDAILAETE